jgi:argininosuccinate synthase
MDELGGFEPTDTTGFIQIESIRIKKCVPYRSIMIFGYDQNMLLINLYLRWAQANIRKGQAGVEPKDVYGTRI